MSKTIILLPIFLLLLGIVNASVDVTLPSYSPFPAKPGDTLTLQFIVQNTGSENIVNFTSVLETEDDLFAISPITQTIPLLQQDEQRAVVYTVGVSGSASGTQNLILRYGAQNLQSDSESFDISITTSKDVVVIKKVNSIPNVIAPGESGSIRIDIENTGDERINDVFVKLDLSGDVPFAPRDSSTEQRISRISKESTESSVFNINVLSSADEKIYKIPVRISYTDEFGQKFVKSDIVSINVGTKPNLELSIDSGGFVVGQKGKISIKAVNSGLGDVKFLNVKLLPGNYEIMSADQVYIGNINSDDFQTADFEVMFKNTNPTLNIEVSYKDSSNNDYLQDIDLPAKVYTLEKAKELGLARSSNTAAVVIGIIVLIILVIVLRRFLRKRKKE